MNREQRVWEQGKTWENYKERGKTFNGIYASKGGGNHVMNRRIKKDRKGNCKGGSAIGKSTKGKIAFWGTAKGDSAKCEIAKSEHEEKLKMVKVKK